jgi:hypothetical protein
VLDVLGPACLAEHQRVSLDEVPQSGAEAQLGVAHGATGLVAVMAGVLSAGLVATIIVEGSVRREATGSRLRHGIATAQDRLAQLVDKPDVEQQ